MDYLYSTPCLIFKIVLIDDYVSTGNWSLSNNIYSSICVDLIYKHINKIKDNNNIWKTYSEDTVFKCEIIYIGLSMSKWKTVFLK